MMQRLPKQYCTRCGRGIPPRMRDTSFCSHKCADAQLRADESSAASEAAAVANAECRACGGGGCVEDESPEDGTLGPQTCSACGGSGRASGLPSSVVLAVDPAERSAADSWSTPQQSALTPPTPEQPAVTGEPLCADCGQPHEHPDHDPRDYHSHVYRAELTTRDPVSRTLGATDSPRESSTDVDRLQAILRNKNLDLTMPDREYLADSLTDLSSTRTALQRVREAAQEFYAARDLYQTPGVAPEMRSGISQRFFNAEMALRALTSSETDQ